MSSIGVDTSSGSELGVQKGGCDAAGDADGTVGEALGAANGEMTAVDSGEATGVAAIDDPSGAGIGVTSGNPSNDPSGDGSGDGDASGDGSSGVEGNEVGEAGVIVR